MADDDWEGFDDLPGESPSTASEPSSEDLHMESDTDSDLFSAEEDDALIPLFPAGVIEGATTRDDLKNALRAHGKLHGYATALRGGHKKDGLPTYYGIYCVNFGHPAPSQASGLRKTTTKRTGCQFKASAKLTPEGWLICHDKRLEHCVHNHPPALDASAFPQNRRIEPAVRATIERLSAYISIRAREILAMVQQEYPDSNYTTKDINNVRQAIRRRERAGCMASGATIKAFDDLGVAYIAKWDDDDPDRLLGLAFSFQTCQEMWKRFPDCLSLDNTHRTNNLGFPLFVVTVQTNVNSIANVAFGLIGDETRESFDFLADGVD